MRIFMQGLVGCSMREGVCARAYIQQRALTASRRSMDTSIFTTHQVLCQHDSAEVL